MIGDTWYTTASMITLKYLLADYSKHKARLHQLDLIVSFIQANVKHRVFVNPDRRYRECFPEYSNYFGRPLILKKSMYGMNNSGRIFYGDITNWLIEQEGFKKSQCQMSIYYNYETDVSKLVVLSYVYACVYWYTYEELVN